MEDQQFRHWLKAPQFSSARRQSMEVKGCRGSHTTSEGRAGHGRSSQFACYCDLPKQSKVGTSGVVTPANRETVVMKGEQSQDPRNPNIVNFVIVEN